MTTQTEERTAIEMLAQRYGEAWNRQDLDAIMDLHADDCVFVAHAAGSPPAGPETRSRRRVRSRSAAARRTAR